MTHILVDFVLKKMTEEVITPEKHPRRIAQGHTLATLMKKKRYYVTKSSLQNNLQNSLQDSLLYGMSKIQIQLYSLGKLVVENSPCFRLD